MKTKILIHNDFYYDWLLIETQADKGIVKSFLKGRDDISGLEPYKVLRSSDKDLFLPDETEYDYKFYCEV